jgi:thiol-disulfide isomerase/thioredoxin
MRKSLKSFGMGMSMAIAAAIAVPSAYAADAPAGTAAPSDTSEQKKLGVGDAAPAWKDLVGVDDQKHSLGEHADAKAVVVVFTCNHCPVAKAYEDRIVEIATDYADKDVDVVAINVSNLDADKLPAMKERAEEKGFKFNYLYDPSQEIARAYAATVTPHVFLLDGERNIAYIGAIDDNMKADKATKPYLRDAIDAVLAGSKPQTDSTKPVGCGIKYE